MTLTIHPDPGHPAGGYAFLELPDRSLPDHPVEVAIRERFGGRWLGTGAADDGEGEHGAWQAQRHDFGPIDVHRHDGADWVRLGPEIVDQIEEYAPLSIEIGGHAHDVTWPDDVPPRAAVAVLGALQPTARPVAATLAQVPVGMAPDPVPEPAPEPEPDLAPMPEPDPETGQWWHGFVLPALLVFGVLVAILAAWFLMPGDDDAAVVPDTPVAADGCTPGALNDLGGGFAARDLAIRACGAAVSADTVLRIVEDAAGRSDPQALLLFGTLYDGAQVDDRIEKVIGLTFEHDAAQAAEYYARAAQSGSDTARDRLAAVCAQLAGSDQTLAKGAYDDFCG